MNTLDSQLMAELVHKAEKLSAMSVLLELLEIERGCKDSEFTQQVIIDKLLVLLKK